MTNTGKTKLSRERNSSRRWTSTEEVNILWYIKEEDESGRKLEKPTARLYYQRLLENVAIKDATFVQLKNKVANMKRKFIDARKWLKDSGNGISAEGPLEGSIAAHVNGICPHYKLLEDIFAQKVNIVIPFDFDTSMPDTNVVQTINEITQVPANNTNNLEEDDIINMIVIYSPDPQIPVESSIVDMTDMSDAQQAIVQFLPQAKTSSVNQNVATTDQNIAEQESVNQDNVEAVNRYNEAAVDQSNVTSSNQINEATSNQSSVTASNQNTIPTINRNNVTVPNKNKVPAVKRNSKNMAALNEEEDLLVCRFKKDLLTPVPHKMHKSIPSNAAAFISDANFNRAEALKQRNVIDMKRVENDEAAKTVELEISKERLRLEKEFQLSDLELKKFEQENLNDKNLLEKLRLKNEFEISKERLAMETQFRSSELELQKSQQEKLDRQNEFELKRVESEINNKTDEVQLKKERFVFEKEVQLKQLELEKTREQNQHEIEKFKLEYQFKLDLEIAKQNRAN